MGCQAGLTDKEAGAVSTVLSKEGAPNHNRRLSRDLTGAGSQWQGSSACLRLPENTREATVVTEEETARGLLVRGRVCSDAWRRLMLKK